MASTAAVPSNHKTVNRRRQTTPDSTPDSTRTRQESPTTSRPEVGEEEASIETSSQESEWWQVKKIIAERAGKYQILWEGIDPKTKKPWPLEWVSTYDPERLSITP